MDTAVWRRTLPQVAAAVAVAAVVALAACVDDASPPTAPDSTGELLLGVTSNGGCVPDAIITTTDSTETILVNFTNEVGYSCTTDGSPYGIGFGPFPEHGGTTSYRSCFDAEGFCNNVTDVPSPAHWAQPHHAPSQGLIEFDPPVRSIEFSYHGYRPECHYDPDCPDTFYATGHLRSANGLIGYQVAAGSMTTHGFDLPTEWDFVQLSSGADNISWLLIDGYALIDDFKVTRGIVCTESAQAASTFDLCEPPPEPCDSIFEQPTGDPWLDSPLLQEALYDAFVNQSQAYNPYIEQRLETRGYLYERPDGSRYWKHTEVYQKRTGCGATGPPAKDDPADIVLVNYHSQPFSHWDTLPQNCGPGLAGQPYDARSYGVFSSTDWLDVVAVDADFGVTDVVIDYDWVAVADPSLLDTGQFSQTPKYAWNPNLCE